jgi:hypothetical protein
LDYLEVHIYFLVSIKLTNARMVTKIHTVPRAKKTSFGFGSVYFRCFFFGSVSICTGLFALTLPNAATGEIPAERASHRRRHAYPGTQHNFVQHTKEQQLETSTQDSRS